VDGFRMGSWPVTVAEYARFLEEEGYGNREWWQEERFGKWSGPDAWGEQKDLPNRPVTGVSWYEALAYCAWLTAQRHRAGLLPEGRVIRLPGEAEWEWAARRGTERRYPWGNEEPDPERMSYGGKVERATPVGIYPAGATPDGLLDMASNVWEWCLNKYDEPAVVAEDTSDDLRVVRGGSWLGDPGSAGSAVRGGGRPYGRDDDLGFRVLCAAPICSDN
jgi:formylglycine-generating enzyme required for sulfatase activity